MNSMRREIIEYYTDLRNKIDIQSEKVIEKQDESLDMNSINKTRSLLIEKINDLEKLSLDKLSNLSNSIVQHHFCYFVRNYQMKNQSLSILEIGRKEILLNPIGFLIITNYSLSENAVSFLK